MSLERRAKQAAERLREARYRQAQFDALGHNRIAYAVAVALAEIGHQWRAAQRKAAA